VHRVAVLDARRGESYAASFECEAELPAARPDLLQEGVYSPAQLGEQLNEPMVLVGEGASGLRDELARECGWPADLECCDAFPRAQSVAALGAQLLEQGQGMAVASLVPQYGRRAQAEEDRALAGR
jgi:tRNA A37 threonylcarbamoyladenosine modification protein TsaB